MKGPLNWAGLALLACALAFATATTVWAVKRSFDVRALRQGVGDIVFHAADGTPWFRLDEHRRDVPIEQISPHLRSAVVAVEDHRFAWHPGIDPLAVARASIRTLQGDREGGSTITQQLARTLFLSNARTPARKAKEAVIALMLDLHLSKEQILELYLNRIYLSAGIYGVQSMSTMLFGKPARDLTLAEAALVAGLIRSPGALSPWSNLDGAVRRSHVVLARMREEGLITEAQERAARRGPIRVRARTATGDVRGGYAKEYLRQQFRERFGGDNPPHWQVHTTFSPALQAAAERAVADGLRRIGRADLQAALVALDPDTGDLRALVGGSDYRRTPFNRAVRSKRQPGSAFKPFVFAAALERGFSPVSSLKRLSTIAPQGPEEWTPRNAGGEVDDELTLREALFESNNRAAVALQTEIGTRPVLRLVKAAGLDDQPNVPSLALGSGLVTPLALTSAYAVFPNGGHAVRPRSIVRVLDADGSVALATVVERERVLPPQVAFQMVTMMRDVVERGTGRGARAQGLSFPVGAKTGSTNDFKDAWFVGYSSALVVGVWVGFDQPASIGREAFGARVALPIWHDFMRRAAALPVKGLQRPGEFQRPGGLQDEELCRVSYQRPVEGCPTYLEYFKEGDHRPGRLCELHRGSFKQRARRAIEGFFADLGREVIRIVRRR